MYMDKRMLHTVQSIALLYGFQLKAVVSGRIGVSVPRIVEVGRGSEAEAVRRRETAVKLRRKNVTPRTAIPSPTYKV